VEIEGAEHGGEQTWTMDVTKEAATHTLWRSKVRNTAVSKLDMDVTKEAATHTCGDQRCGTQR